jgi:hypothetical protein
MNDTKGLHVSLEANGSVDSWSRGDGYRSGNGDHRDGVECKTDLMGILVCLVEASGRYSLREWRHSALRASLEPVGKYIENLFYSSQLQPSSADALDNCGHRHLVRLIANFD